MSTEEESRKPESEMGLDLDLHFLPAWAQKSAAVNQYEQYTGGEGGRGGDRRGGGRRDFGNRPPRREGGPRPQGRGPGGPGGPGGFGGQRPGFGGRPQGDRRREGGGRGFDRGDRRGGGPQRGGPPAPPVKLPELEVNFFPEEKGVESLARQIKLSGRSYPLFEIAYLVLKKPERYHVQLTSKKKEDGTPVQPLYICALDDSLWLDENDAARHVLEKHTSTFYSMEKIPTEPPKGVYTFVAQCGMSGAILGPPNYHDYQNKLHKLHQERFSRMPFEAFKSRIKIVKDEAVVKKWLEEQSFRPEYTCLNVPETIKLNSWEEVEKHFRETHLPNVIKQVDSHTLPGTAAVNVQNRPLQSLVRRSYDEQMRFPLKVVNILSGQFARQGLQFFKVNKSVTHVAIARPRYLDMEESISDGIRKIVEFINTHPRTTRKKLIEALAPGVSMRSVPKAPPPAEPAPAAEGTPEAQPVTGEGQAASTEAQPAPAAADVPPEIGAIVSDLHWLVHQGHVIEFANGILETAKKPLPRPPKPEKQPKQGAAAAAASTEEAAGEVTTQAGVVEGQGTDAETSGGESASDAANVQDESGGSAGADDQGGAEIASSQSVPENEEQNKTQPQQ